MARYGGSRFGREVELSDESYLEVECRGQLEFHIWFNRASIDQRPGWGGVAML